MPKTVYSSVKLYTDGGARGNPGPAGAGVVIKNKEGETLDTHHEYVGETTNNQAEYRALVLGLDLASKYTNDTVNVFMDSELIVKQLKGEYKMKEPTLFPFQQEVFKHQKKFKNVTFTHIRRENNKEADALVNKAIDQAQNI